MLQGINQFRPLIQTQALASSNLEEKRFSRPTRASVAYKASGTVTKRKDGLIDKIVFNCEGLGPTKYFEFKQKASIPSDDPLYVQLMSSYTLDSNGRKVDSVDYKVTNSKSNFVYMDPVDPDGDQMFLYFKANGNITRCKVS